MEDVVHHAASVAYLEAPWLDASHRGGPDDGHHSSVCFLDQHSGHVLRDSLSNDGNGSNLQVFKTTHSVTCNNININ